MRNEQAAPEDDTLASEDNSRTTYTLDELLDQMEGKDWHPEVDWEADVGLEILPEYEPKENEGGTSVRAVNGPVQTPF